MLSVLNPYLTGIKIVLICLLLGADFYAGYHLRDISAVRQQEEFTIQAQKQAAVYTAQSQALANQAEEQNAASQKKHNDELAYYRALVAKRGGLYDTHSTTSRPTTGNPGSTESTPSANRLSEEATGFLLDLTNKADQVVDQYLTCQKYVEGLKEIK